MISSLSNWVTAKIGSTIIALWRGHTFMRYFPYLVIVLNVPDPWYLAEWIPLPVLRKEDHNDQLPDRVWGEQCFLGGPWRLVRRESDHGRHRCWMCFGSFRYHVSILLWPKSLMALPLDYFSHVIYCVWIRWKNVPFHFLITQPGNS